MTKTTHSTASDKKVPRPMNCFLAFRLEKQNEIVSRCPGANHRDISKIIAKWWKEISEEEKEPYRERARLAKIAHAKLYPDYKYQPQKKNGRKTRKYVRRPQNKFTSRVEQNNRIMEMFYENPQLLSQKNGSSDDTDEDTKLSVSSPQSFSSCSNMGSPSQEDYTNNCHNAVGNAEPYSWYAGSPNNVKLAPAFSDPLLLACNADYSPVDYSSLTHQQPVTVTSDYPLFYDVDLMNPQTLFATTEACIDPRLLETADDPVYYPMEQPQLAWPSYDFANNVAYQ
ncbi:hypothetical protein BJV82DRAFT_666229 [Fennellomyces sp. T-0311]|nr:hypothetical protein BJV82DRAFT_666229 [Fennellomyces sp. T-0311]